MRHFRLFFTACVVACSPQSVRTADDVRAELCGMVGVLPDSPERTQLEMACAVSAPLSTVAAAFERCEGSR